MMRRCRRNMPQSEEKRRLAALGRSNEYHDAACQLMSESNYNRAMQLFQSCLQVSGREKAMCLHNVWLLGQRRISCVTSEYGEPSK